jgi:hypothetical protein
MISINIAGAEDCNRSPTIMEVFMDLLVTVIGNAVVHPDFRKALLKDPPAAIDEWGFRLTKGEEEMLIQIFGDAERKEEEKKEMEQKLYELETLVYKYIPPCGKPCRMSIPAPLQVRKASKKAA